MSATVLFEGGENVLNLLTMFCLTRSVPSRVDDCTDSELQNRFHHLPARAWHCTGLGYLTEMFTPVTDDRGSRHLRSTARGDIVVPRTNTRR